MYIRFFILFGSLLVGQYQYQEMDELNDPPNLYDPLYQSSLIIPYFESFSNFKLENINSTNEIWGLEYFRNRHGTNYWLETFDDNISLALRVFPKDVAAMNNCSSSNNCSDLDTLVCCSSRDRCEAKVYPHHTKGAFYYGWEFMIPEDFIFQKEGNDSANLGKKTRHFIAQWHQAYVYESTRRDPNHRGMKVKWKYNQTVDCNGRKLNLRGKPPITFNLMHDDTDNDHRLDLVISYGTQYNFHWLENCIPDTNSVIGGRQYRLENIVQPGVWVSILTEINWSTEFDDGYMCVWINDQPYQIQIKDGVRYLTNNSEMPPSKLKGANLYIDSNGYAQPNYLKLGHYRSNISVPHTIFIDDVKIASDPIN